MDEVAKRIIVIGSEGHYGVKTAPWDVQDMPNIADFEDVILDISSLTSLLEKVDDNNIPEEQRGKLVDRIYDNLEHVKDRLINVLHSQGNIYVICSPEIRLTYGNYSNYDWSPFPINLVHEKGETIDKIDDSFAHYFQFVKKWSFYFEDIKYVDSEINSFYGSKYYVKPETEVIAENRYKKPIAIRLRYSLHKRIKMTDTHKALAKVYGWENFGYSSEAEHISGDILLLPPPTEIDIKEAINILLEDFWHIQQKTPPPEGIDKILVPGEDVLKQEIQNKVDNIEELKSEISELEVRKEEVAQFKQLLYETGQPLENICKLTLRKLGCDIDDSVEDFILTKGDKEAIVEVKGRERTILREDGAQLSQNRRNYAISKGKAIKDVKAILLGNPWRLLLPLEERIKKGSFATHLVGDAKVEDMALVTTAELFRAYCAFLENKVSVDEIINRLFSGIGLAKLIKE